MSHTLFCFGKDGEGPKTQKHENNAYPNAHIGNQNPYAHSSYYHG